MSVVINGTTGITSTGGYSGDGISFADNTPSNTLVTDTSGNVGIGTSSPDSQLHLSKGSGDQILKMAGASRTWGFRNQSDGTQGLFDFTASAWVTQADSSQNFKFNSGYGSVATAYGCRAWVNFNGTGTVAIRASGNVSSITDNGTGDYTINFTSSMPDANYSMCVGNGSFNDGVNDNNMMIVAPRRGTVNPLTTSGARINSAYRAVGSISQFDDPGLATLAFFR